MKELWEQHGGTVVDVVSVSTTHIFSDVHDPVFDQHEVAIVVSPEFISACISAQRLLSESDYEVRTTGTNISKGV